MVKFDLSENASTLLRQPKPLPLKPPPQLKLQPQQITTTTITTERPVEPQPLPISQRHGIIHAFDTMLGTMNFANKSLMASQLQLKAKSPMAFFLSAEDILLDSG